jgi:hypothetical protein
MHYLKITSAQSARAAELRASGHKAGCRVAGTHQRKSLTTPFDSGAEKPKGAATMKKEITWTTGAGKTAKVTVELITEKVMDADGDKITVKCCEIVVTASVDGMGILGMGRPQSETKQGVAGRIGKLGMVKANLDRVNAAITEIEASQEWIAKISRQDKADKAHRNIDAHQKRMAHIMATQG